MSRKIFVSFLFFLGLLLAACTPTPSPEPTTNADMPNPASVFCEENGGRLEIRTDANGGQAGVCLFPDGSECDEWAFFRSECKPGDSLNPQDIADQPNPASAFCQQNAGTLEIRTDINGNQYGMCLFADGSECDEWAFFRGECKPGESFSPFSPNNPAAKFCTENVGRLEVRNDADGKPVGMCIYWDGSECEIWSYFRGECREGQSLNQSTTTPPAPQTAEDGCLIFRNQHLGYSFHYPADVQIGTASNYDFNVSLTGPLVDGENWPIIYLNHPQQRLEFSLPEGADLEQWLIDQNLLVEERKADTEIAGTKAIHIHHPRSPQSYASDTFFFAHQGQIYSLILLHTGDKQDWELYNHILESITFEK